MIKKIILSVLMLCLIFSINVSAQNKVSINPNGDFYIYGKENDKIEKILNLSQNELTDYCTNNHIEFLAINKKNTKQIRLVAKENDFASSVVNISGLSNDKITSILPQIVGIEGVKGEIINKNGQKFIKTVLRSSDSGGEYILTEYITVADKKSIVLSFYTDINENTDYIEKTFKTYNYYGFIEEQNKRDTTFLYVIAAFTVIFILIFLFIGATVIIDLRKNFRGN